jgi:hypothetical protein
MTGTYVEDNQVATPASCDMARGLSSAYSLVLGRAYMHASVPNTPRPYDDRPEVRANPDFQGRFIQ